MMGSSSASSDRLLLQPRHRCPILSALALAHPGIPGIPTLIPFSVPALPPPPPPGHRHLFIHPTPCHPPPQGHKPEVPAPVLPAVTELHKVVIPLCEEKGQERRAVDMSPSLSSSSSAGETDRSGTLTPCSRGGLVQHENEVLLVEASVPPPSTWSSSMLYPFVAALGLPPPTPVLPTSTCLPS
ncbi:hypothetical protein GALMADRAFT_1129365 [Galerina marginata CBS 339.88]|uniref:Uncharacterized protein n=1 Tax=Galerina marginata (strain CBS 339.88) TaxID=685588 RepID=A0A067SHB5_GALM3|nr:hypothetical protein GALMADRAFT_1129365 [Galerina marginata CBS 339.88]